MSIVIKGRRRGGGKKLAEYFMKSALELTLHPEENSIIRAVFGFGLPLSEEGLRQTLLNADARALRKGDNQGLYHATFALSEGERLTPRQFSFALAYYIKYMGFEGLPHVAVEEWKPHRGSRVPSQHFHIGVGLIREDGTTASLSFSERKQFRIARFLETHLGLTPMEIKGKSAIRAQIERSKRNGGIDPRELKRILTNAYNVSRTTDEFLEELEKHHLSAATPRRGNGVAIIDAAGNIFGLCRNIEGGDGRAARLKDVYDRFPGLATMDLPFATYVSAKKRAEHQHHQVHRVYRCSKRGDGKGFVSQLRQSGFSVLRHKHIWAAVSSDGGFVPFVFHNIRTSHDLYKVFPNLIDYAPPYTDVDMRRFEKALSRFVRRPRPKWLKPKMTIADVRRARIREIMNEYLPRIDAAIVNGTDELLRQEMDGLIQHAEELEMADFQRLEQERLIADLANAALRQRLDTGMASDDDFEAN